MLKPKQWWDYYDDEWLFIKIWILVIFCQLFSRGIFIQDYNMKFWHVKYLSYKTSSLRQHNYRFRRSLKYTWVTYNIVTIYATSMHLTLFELVYINIKWSMNPPTKNKKWTYLWQLYMSCHINLHVFCVNTIMTIS